MKCINCGVPAHVKPLSRTKPLGQPDGGWMCQACMKKKEPELYNNLKDDGDFKITNDIFNALNGGSNVCGCPICGAPEVEAMTPRTVYACGSSDYDQRPNTFTQKCHQQ